MFNKKLLVVGAAILALGGCAPTVTAESPRSCMDAFTAANRGGNNFMGIPGVFYCAVNGQKYKVAHNAAVAADQRAEQEARERLAAENRAKVIATYGSMNAAREAERKAERVAAANAAIAAAAQAVKSNRLFMNACMNRLPEPQSEWMENNELNKCRYNVTLLSGCLTNKAPWNVVVADQIFGACLESYNMRGAE